MSRKKYTKTQLHLQLYWGKRQSNKFSHWFEYVSLRWWVVKRYFRVPIFPKFKKVYIVKVLDFFHNLGFFSVSPWNILPDTNQTLLDLPQLNTHAPHHLHGFWHHEYFVPGILFFCPYFFQKNLYISLEMADLFSDILRHTLQHW